MTDKNININAKIETSAMISGIKQMTDELKKFASEAQRSGNLIGNAFKGQSSEIQQVTKQFDFLANSIKNVNSAFSSLKQPSWLKTGGVGSSQSIARVQQNVLNNYLKNTKALPTGDLLSVYPSTGKSYSQPISEINKLADAEIKLQAAVKRSKEELDRFAGSIRDVVTISSRAQNLNSFSHALDSIKNKLRETSNSLKNFLNLPIGKSFLAGIAGGATVAAFNAIGQAVQRLVNDVVKLGEESVKMSVTYDRLTNRFNAASGGVKSGTESWIFMKNLSKEMGVSFVETADSFGTFEAAALRSGMSMDQTQQVFSDISAAVVSLQLDSYRTGLSFMALSQMASKGTVQMEELKRQLGESLPGAVQIGARAMGMTNAQFHKMVEEGKILSSDFLPKFAAQVKKELGGSLATASQQARAEFNRLVNATNDLKDALGDLINLALVPLAKNLTPVLSEMSVNINKFVEMEKVTHDLSGTLNSLGKAIKAVGDSLMVTGTLFATGGLIVALANLRAVLPIVTGFLINFAKGLTLTKSAWIALGVAILGVSINTGINTFKTSELNRTSNEQLEIAKKKYGALVDEEFALKKLEGEMSSAIAEYEELRKTKNKTNDQQKRFIDLQNILIKAFPDLADGLKKEKSFVVELADAYTGLAKAKLEVRNASILEEIKDIYAQNTPIQKSFFEKMKMSKEERIALYEHNKNANPSATTEKVKPLLKELQANKALMKLYETGSGIENNVKTGDGEDSKVSERKKAFDDEIKAVENELSLKIAKNRYSEEELIKLKQESTDKKLDIANKYYVAESDALAKADYSQAVQKAEAEKFELLKQSINNESNLYLDSQDKLLAQLLAKGGLSEEKELELKIEYNKKKLDKVNDFIKSTGTKEKEWLDKKHELEVNAANLSIELKKKTLEKDLKEIEISASRELALTYMTEKEKLAKTVEVEQARLNLYNQTADGSTESVIRIEEQQNKVFEAQRAVIEEQLKYIRDLFSGIESSFKDSVSGILKGQSTLKDGFTSLIVGIKNAWMDMIAQMITDFMKMAILDPIMKNIFNSMNGGVVNTVQNTAKSVQTLESGMVAINAVAPVMAGTLSVVQPPLVSLTPIMNKAAEAVAKFAVSSAAASVAIIPILGAALADIAAVTTGGSIATGITAAIAPMKFSKGGIVPGSFSQSMPAVVEGSEMILNPRQQNNMFKMIDNGGQRSNKQSSGGFTVVNAPQITTGAKKEDVLSALKESNKELANMITGIIQGNTGGQIRQVIRSV